MRMRNLILFVSACCLSLSACSKSNNLLAGRVEGKLDSHTIVVTDCYRTSVPAPMSDAGADGVTTYRFTPCKDAAISIRESVLTVNGQTYGKLAASDSVTVDHGKVLINAQAAQVIAQNP